jgi:hypothetical protein
MPGRAGPIFRDTSPSRRPARQPALAVAAGHVRDRLARLKLDVGSAQRRAINRRLLSFVIRIKLAARRLKDLPLAVLLMLLDRFLDLLGLLRE